MGSIQAYLSPFDMNQMGCSVPSVLEIGPVHSETVALVIVKRSFCCFG